MFETKYFLYIKEIEVVKIKKSWNANDFYAD
jgi:hypothetical protein